MAALVLATASAVLRYWSLAQTSFSNGWDSYFYLVQLKSVEETGRMHSPDASIIYPYLRLLYWLTGDYVMALKVGTALLCALWTALMWRMGGLVLAAWSVFSPHLVYFAAQYPKNLLGVVLLVAFIGALEHRPRGGPGKPFYWLFPLLLLLLNYFGHRLTFVLALSYLVSWLVGTWKPEPARLIFSRKTLLVAGAAIGVFMLVGRFFPGLFHVVDLGRLKGAWAWPPQFAPYSFVVHFGLERISGWWLAEIGVVTGCWLWALIHGAREKFKPSSTVRVNGSLAILSTLLLFPFLEWSFTGVAWRLFLVFVLLTPLSVIGFQILENRRSGLVFVTVMLCCSLFSWKTYSPKMHDPDYSRFSSITEQARAVLKEKQVELVIAHNALAEFFTYTTGADAMPWLPEYEADSLRLWRIATGASLQMLRYYAGANSGTIKPLGYGYFMLPEYVWQVARRRAEEEQDEYFLTETADWRNPSRIRPSWLLHRKRTH
ncbi:MAG: hypothetical protein KF734_00260 [Saprospiraceae bacterium]|nr:hypothetical protein [Saprospiraceae bacterium]